MMLNMPLPHKLARERRNARGTPIIKHKAVVPTANPRLFLASVR